MIKITPARTPVTTHTDSQLALFKQAPYTIIDFLVTYQGGCEFCLSNVSRSTTNNHVISPCLTNTHPPTLWSTRIKRGNQGPMLSTIGSHRDHYSVSPHRTAPGSTRHQLHQTTPPARVGWLGCLRVYVCTSYYY